MRDDGGMVTLRILYLTLGVVALVIASMQVVAYYYLEKSYLVSSTPSSLVSIDALIDYGNGTRHWYNGTVPSGWNSYQLTVNITNGHVEADAYPSPLDEHLVKSINGVRNNNTFSWWLWTFCQKNSAWASSGVGADLLHLSNGQIIAWAYERSTQQPPVPNAKTIGSC